MRRLALVWQGTVPSRVNCKWRFLTTDRSTIQRDAFSISFRINIYERFGHLYENGDTNKQYSDRLLLPDGIVLLQSTVFITH
jgi:hypothetical protein